MNIFNLSEKDEVAEMTIDGLIDQVKTYLPADEDFTMLRLAYDFAAEAHTGQTRVSGDFYISHPLATTYNLAAMKADMPTLLAGLLHDVRYLSKYSRNRKKFW